MRDVFINLFIRVRDCRPVSPKQHAEIWELPHSLKRGKIVAHVSFRWIDQHRAKPDNVISGNERPDSLVVEAEVPTRMTRAMQSTQTDRRFAINHEHFVIFT